MEKSINIGNRRELFVDEYLIDTCGKDVSLRLHTPMAREKVFVTDQAWEGNICGYITVFQDSERFRMYYKARNVCLEEVKGEEGECPDILMPAAYAESTDAIHWERPNLGFVDFAGSSNNNIVWADNLGCPGFTPFLDTNPACPPDQRYKATGSERLDPSNAHLWAMCSADGIHWRLLSDKPLLRNDLGNFDSQNVAFWDAERGEYRIYFRDYRDGIRLINTSVSPDFIHWSKPEPLTYPGAPPEQMYTNQVQPCPNAPHIFVGFPTRYIERDWSPTIEALPEAAQRRHRRKTCERYGTVLTDGLFMSSRDGHTFKRWGEAFLRPGPQLKGNWAYGDNYQCCGIIKTPAFLDGAPDEYSFYATENYWHGAVIFRRYSIRQDGFVSVQAPLSGGEFTTKPLVFSGKRLELNFATSAAGSVRVELQDADGNPLPGFTLKECYEIIGDELNRTVKWENGDNLEQYAGQAIRLRIALSDADLYAMRFAPEEEEKNSTRKTRD